MYENCKINKPYKNNKGVTIVRITFPDGKVRDTSYAKYLMECQLGREIDKKKEKIWHIDGDKDNNDLSNLTVKSLEEISKLMQDKHTTKTCPKCNQEIDINTFDKHINSCDGNFKRRSFRHKKDRIDWEQYKNSDGTFTCPKCKRTFYAKNAIGIHYVYCVEGKEYPTKGISCENATQIHYGNNRSKNETHFYNLCVLLLGQDKVLNNERMFDGWDADIIIPEYKLAILWNGIWHYEKIFEKQDLEKTKRRDIFKENLITTKFGYTVYVIKDLGSENQGFVSNEFIKFIKLYFSDLINNAYDIIKNYSFKLPKTIKTTDNIDIITKEVKVTKKEQRRLNKIKRRVLTIYRIHLLRTSDIDFTSEGWITKASELLGISNINAWAKRHIPEFWKTCYHRK